MNPKTTPALRASIGRAELDAALAPQEGTENLLYSGR